MIEELHIQGLGVIDDALLELSPGLTVVTGETGAGKTMVVTGLGLLFGGRADAGAVRTGAARALVEGRLVLASGSAAEQRALDAGAELDDGALILARSVSGEGRSRAWAGGRGVPAGVLADLADELVAVHGQSDQQRLLQPARQRAALDRYAGDPVEHPLAAYRDRYSRLRDVEGELERLATSRREREQEADRLRFGLTEIEAVAPQPGEDGQLDVEARRLGNADELRTAAELAHAALLGDPDSDAAADAPHAGGGRPTVARAGQGDDPALGALSLTGWPRWPRSRQTPAPTSRRTPMVSMPTRSASGWSRTAAPPSKASRASTAPNIDEVLEWSARAAKDLEQLDGDGERGSALTAERDRLRDELAALAAEVSTARSEAALRFGADVTAELVELAMPHAAISVAMDEPGRRRAGRRRRDPRLRVVRHRRRRDPARAASRRPRPSARPKGPPAASCPA